VQNALVRTYSAWSRVRTEDASAAYARRVLVNAHTDWWREQRVEDLPESAGGDETDRLHDRDALIRALGRLGGRSGWWWCGPCHCHGHCGAGRGEQRSSSG
jgi:DNA-directed RNA polymerase specialized sigma24 family protein